MDANQRALLHYTAKGQGMQGYGVGFKQVLIDNSVCEMTKELGCPSGPNNVEAFMWK